MLDRPTIAQIYWAVALCLWATAFYPLQAQQNRADSLFFDFEQKSYQTEKRGMQVLGGWALANFAVSGGVLLAGRGHNPDFYRTNIYWNVVNAGLAGMALVRLKPPVASESNFSLSALERHNRHEKLLLLNAGLDLAYVATGVWMQERGRRIGGGSGRQWRGTGESLILQGAFLLAFDLAMHTLLNKHKKRFIQQKPIY